MKRPHLRPDGIPTRFDDALKSPAELAICAAIEEVERAGCSEKLTEAVLLLKKARHCVADHVEADPEGKNDTTTANIWVVIDSTTGTRILLCERHYKQWQDARDRALLQVADQFRKQWGIGANCAN